MDTGDRRLLRNLWFRHPVQYPWPAIIGDGFRRHDCLAPLPLVRYPVGKRDFSLFPCVGVFVALCGGHGPIDEDPYHHVLHHFAHRAGAGKFPLLFRTGRF